jgi:DNA primase
LFFYTVRVNLGDTDKMTPPLSFHDDGKWHFKGLPEVRPLYNLQRLCQNPSAQAIVVEGEKCADAFQGLLDAAGFGVFVVVTTWVGGAKSALKTDFSPLFGRKCVLWPDNDAEGMDAMQTVCGILQKGK